MKLFWRGSHSPVALHSIYHVKRLNLHDDPPYLCRESLRIKFWRLFLLLVNGQVFVETYPDFSFSR